MNDRARLLKTRGFNQLAEVAEGYLLYNVNDRYTGKAIARYGEYAAEEMQTLDALVRPADVVLDVGANIGTHAVAFARRVGPQGRVIALEPQRLVFQVLCANVALNSLSNVECHWAAAGESNGSIMVPELDAATSGDFAGVSLEGVGQGSRVSQIALDGMVSLEKLRLLKIDVEGMEAGVIRGAQGLIRRFRPFLYVENDRRDRSEALMRLIDSLGYAMHWDAPLMYNAANYYGDAENVFGTLAYWNLLCVPREQSGLIDAPEITDFTIHPFDGRSGPSR